MKLSRFLLAYRNAEHQTTGTNPASLFYGRYLPTRLEKLKPSLRKRVENQQSSMCRSTTDRDFDVGDCVVVRDYLNGHDTWIPGKISVKTGPVSYRVEIAPGFYWHRHADHIRSSELVPEQSRVVRDSSFLPLPTSVDNHPPASQSSSSQSSSSQSPPPAVQSSVTYESCARSTNNRKSIKTTQMYRITGKTLSN